MTSLSFDAAAGLIVPVEIYDDELQLVERTLSSCGVTVDAGMYFVLAHLPDGSQLRQSIAVGDEPTVVVQLGDRGRALRYGHTRSFLSGIGGGSDSPDERRTVPLIGYARAEDDTWTAVHHDLVAAGGAAVLVPAEIDAVAVERRDGTLSIVRIPGRRVDYFLFAVVPARAGDGVDLVARVAHNAGDALLGYLNQDMLDDAKTMLDSPALAAERLLRVDEPVAAAAGAYALLRLDALERLHNWTENLANRFEWLPDGLVVWAEHLARLGRHEQAAELLSRLPERGLPALSVGLTYACDRLRTYAGHWPRNVRLRETLEELTRYAVATDFAAPVTTYTGERPDLPAPPAQAALDVPAAAAPAELQPSHAAVHGVT